MENWEIEFREWFDSADLGPLEDVRDFVKSHAEDNVVDVEESMKAYCAIETVKNYLDGFGAEVFDHYRN